MRKTTRDRESAVGNEEGKWEWPGESRLHYNFIIYDLVLYSTVSTQMRTDLLLRPTPAALDNGGSLLTPHIQK